MTENKVLTYVIGAVAVIVFGLLVWQTWQSPSDIGILSKNIERLAQIKKTSDVNYIRIDWQQNSDSAIYVVLLPGQDDKDLMALIETVKSDLHVVSPAKGGRVAKDLKIEVNNKHQGSVYLNLWKKQMDKKDPTVIAPHLRSLNLRLLLSDILQRKGRPVS